MRRFSGSVSVIPYGKPNPLISKRQGGLLKVLSSETSGWAAIAGRPSIHADALAPEICDRIAAGENLGAICRDDHMPGPGDYITPEPAEGSEEIKGRVWAILVFDPLANLPAAVRRRAGNQQL
jgi:Bacteriophage Sf6, terminase small subunit-like